MDKKLQLLESFQALGSDGQPHKVMVYEHLVSLSPPLDGQAHWESTGRIEYRLADGTRVDALADGRLQVHGGALTLQADARA